MRGFFFGLVCFGIMGNARLEAQDNIASHALDTLEQAIAEPQVSVSEESKPIFDPAAYDKSHPLQKAAKDKAKNDKFYEKLRKQRRDFVEDQKKRQREFLTKLQKKDLPYEEFQDKLSKFNQKEQARSAEFNQKQQKAILKQQAKSRE